MTLDECIEWHSDEAEKLKDANPEYAGQCKQIADWLKELKERRESDVKRGTWKEISEYGGWGETCYQCSECKVTEYLPLNYCPNCGADMRGRIMNG